MHIILTILATVIIFLLMIFVHEFGHFIVAKAFKTRVDEFALGMGPLIWQRQRGDTMYSLRALPIGGYCLLGGEDEATDKEGDFVSKAWWQKILVLAAGATMNFILCILLMALIAFIGGTAGNTIGEVIEDSPAAIAGIEAGDEIVSIEGNEIGDWADLTTVLLEQSDAEKALEIDVQRGSENLTFNIVPRYDDELQKYAIGITPKIQHRPLYSLYIGTQSTWNMGKMMVELIGELFVGKQEADVLSGPVGIVQVIGQSVSYGIAYIAYVAALISLNLGIVNLLPFPALDGGRIFFVILRKITGKAITDAVESKFHLVGMALLMVLLIYVTFNDVGRIIG